MISTANGILFDQFSYDFNASSVAPSLPQSVVLASTMTDQQVYAKSCIEDWLDNLWWFVLKFPRTKIPQDFADPTQAPPTFQDWMDLFREKADEVDPSHVEFSTIKMPLPRKNSPPEKQQDWMYFVFSWSSYRKELTLQLPIEFGALSIGLVNPANLEVPPPTMAAPGRIFVLGVFMYAYAAAEPWKFYNTPVDVV